jgi:hypothetical protein
VVLVAAMVEMGLAQFLELLEPQIKDTRVAIISALLTAIKCLVVVVEQEASGLIIAVGTLAQVAQVCLAQSQVQRSLVAVAVAVEMLESVRLVEHLVVAVLVL